MPRFTHAEWIGEALVVGGWQSYCGACGKETLPEGDTHVDVSGYRAEKGGGCGARWKYITSEYAGEQSERVVRDMRPDLEFRPMFHNAKAEATR